MSGPVNAFERMMHASQKQQVGRKRGQQQKQQTPAKRPKQAGQLVGQFASPELSGFTSTIQHLSESSAHCSSAKSAAQVLPVAETSPVDAAAATAADCKSPITATAQYQAAVAAFKRAFSGQQSAVKQLYDFLLVYDMEATCNQAKSLAPGEIIEISCVIVDTKAARVQTSFQAFVRPTEHPQLDPFCIELTGIQQQQVDAAADLKTVLQHHHSWLQEQGMFEQGVRFVPVTWTDWDLKLALCIECSWRRIQRPDYLCSWVNLKRVFTARYKRGGNLRTCVEAAGLNWSGRVHSGLDDATNTARLALKLIAQGAVLEITQTSENPVIHPQRQWSGSSCAPASFAGSQDGIDKGNSGAANRGSNSSNGGKDLTCSKQTSQGSARCKMQILAHSKGASGVFDSGGRWLGKCFCTVKAHFRTTKRPGPNHGRQFYSCGRWTITKQSRQCEFFLWQEDVPPGSTVPKQ